MSNFNIEIEKTSDISILKLSGYLDAHTAPELENCIEDCMKNSNYKLVVNFSGLDYISSAGLGVFMSHIEELRQNGGDIKMSEMKPKVFSVFDLLGFPMLFDIMTNQDEIIKLFNDTRPNE